jgi:hypothetical protein
VVGGHMDGRHGVLFFSIRDFIYARHAPFTFFSGGLEPKK